MSEAAPVAPVTAAPAEPAAEAQEGAEEGEEAPLEAKDDKPEAKAKPAAQAKPPPEELFELKVNGKVEKLTRSQLLLRAQKAEAGERRFREAAEAQKKAEALIAEFEADPEAVLAKLGKDPSAIIDAHLAKKAKDATLTPEQRELEQLRKERDELKAKHEATEKEKQTAAQAAEDEKTAARLEETLLSAADKAGMDRNAQTLEQLCDVALEYIEMGIQVDAAQVCDEVQRRQKEHVSARDQKILSKLPDEKLAEYLGPDVLARLNKASLKQIPAPGTKQKQTEPREPKPAKGYLSEADFDKALGFRR